MDLYTVVKAVDSPAESNVAELKRVSRWNHNYFVTSLAVHDGTVIAGDAISSVSVLKVVNNDLQTVARHYGPMWPVAVEGLRDNGVIAANVSSS